MPERPSARHVVGLALVAGLGAALVGPLATWPVYRHMDDGLATVKLGFDHRGQRAKPCRTLTEEEIADLARNMRKTEDCPRGRLPVSVEVLMDRQPLFVVTKPPTGFAGDGASRFYARAAVAAGQHELTLRLRDSARAEGYDYETVVAVTLDPAQVVVIGFDAELAAFTVR